MRTKEKMTLLLLILIFIATVGMFFYQNVVVKNQIEANKVSVIIAKKDITAGSEINEKNTGVMKIEKSAVFPDSLTVKDFKSIEGKKAASDILQNEIINRKRISDTQGEDKQFSINVTPTYSSTLTDNDNIRVYVQIFDKKTKETSLFQLFDKKQIIGINQKKDSSGKVSAVIDSLQILASDEEALNYFNAMKLGDIIVLKYNDITEADKLKVPQFKIDSPEIKKIEANMRETENQKTPANSQTISYLAKDGDTLESIAKSFGTTKEALTNANPGVTEVTPGLTININTK